MHEQRFEDTADATCLSPEAIAQVLKGLQELDAVAQAKATAFFSPPKQFLLAQFGDLLWFLLCDWVNLWVSGLGGLLS